MKNKIRLLIIFFFLLSNTKAETNQSFKFESSELEILNTSNQIKATNGVRIIDNDNSIEITANSSTYFRDRNILEIKGNIKFYDNDNKIEIKSDEIIYNKNIEKIRSVSFTKVNINNKFALEGDDIIFFKNQKKIFSNNKSVISDNYDNLLELSDFKFDLTTNNLRTSSLNFTDQDKNKYISKNAIINLNNEKIAAKDIQIYFSDGELGKNARIKGSSMIKENEITRVENAIFTTCKITGKCPPWKMKSEKIIHDKNKKEINYQNSWLELYDIPVFYFPKFFHPDPTVKRQSGFLIPSFVNSSNTGNSINIPYYKVISDNKDFTIQPRFYSNKDILVQNEFRQVERNSDHITDFSFKKLEKSSKSHFFSNTKYFFENDFSLSELEINLEQTSNDTYLKNDNIKSKTKKNKSQSLLSSFLRFNSSSENTNIFSEINVYEDLSKTKKSDKYQYVLPNFKISQNLSSDLNFDGDLIYRISGSGQKKETNVTEKYLTNDFEYKSNIIFPLNGFTSDYEINFKNSIKDGKNSKNYKNDTQSDNYANFIFNSSYPMKKKSKNFNNNLTPKISLRYSPNKNENLTNLDRQITSTNIFSSNRLGLTDSLEGGQSITAGFQYEIQDEQFNDIFDLNIAQIFRDKNDEKLPINSTMQKKTSDLIGNFNFFPNNKFNLNYNFSADNNFDTMNYSEVKTNININNFITSFEFLEENNNVGSDSYLSTDIKYLFNKNNSILYNTRRNRKTNLTEYYNLIYEYKNDCLVAAVEYNKNYYQDRDLKPSEDIFFSITITPFTSLNSPNLK